MASESHLVKVDRLISYTYSGKLVEHVWLFQGKSDYVNVLNFCGTYQGKRKNVMLSDDGSNEEGILIALSGVYVSM